MASLINKVACRKAVLKYAEGRAHKFTRVGADVLEHLELELINIMKSIVSTHPSMGKTIMMGSKKRSKPEPEEVIFSDDN